MRLNPPTIVVFLISLLLAVLALVVKLGATFSLPIPTLFPNQAFWIAIVAYLVLMVGSLVRGL